jgi:hypothetical protein
MFMIRFMLHLPQFVGPTDLSVTLLGELFRVRLKVVTYLDTKNLFSVLQIVIPFILVGISQYLIFMDPCIVV